MSLDILRRDDLPEGGFAGLREYRLVTDPRAFGDYMADGAWTGIGNFVYLADARFNPKGNTRMHHHREVDVISVMLEGRISHEGSLEHGRELKPFNVQAQRAGGEGFSHNEVNPDDEENRMIQTWILPETPGQPAGYKFFDPEPGEITRVYGGKEEETKSFPSGTLMDVGLMEPGQEFSLAGDFMVYLALGKGMANARSIEEGDLIRGKNLVLKADEKTVCIAFHLNNA